MVGVATFTNKGDQVMKKTLKKTIPDQDNPRLNIVRANKPEPEQTDERIGDDLVRYEWCEETPAPRNYSAMGQLLAQQRDLFRRPGYATGLLLVMADGSQATISNAAGLAPVIVDRVAVSVSLDGRPKGTNISSTHLNSMLRSEFFLGQFPIIDQVTKVPMYLPNFSLTTPGFNDGGPGQRMFYLGNPTAISDSLDRTNAFLDAMSFECNADRTNAVAAALTATLRNHWPGGKPVVLATATKSHAGKDTVLLFAAGMMRLTSISYQSTNWALERSFVGSLNQDPDVGVVVVENARLDKRERFIASAFLERFATDPEPLLFSTGTGPAARRRNDIVLGISTNFGSVSEDLLNRSLPIHLHPVGSVTERHSKIGNPKLEYLPKHREAIAAELRGMIERWKKKGQPLDDKVRHPFSPWAKTIGGILAVSGFKDFLGNYGTRKVADDPLRLGLSLLGAARHGEKWLKPDDWARSAVTLGLTKQVIPAGDQDSHEARKRGIGVILSAHRDETFAAETDSHQLLLRLERKRGRHDREEPHVRYRFVVLEQTPIPEDGGKS